MPHIDIEDLKRGRQAFTKEEWLDVMLRSIGMEPDELTYREKWLLLTRMIPLVENNFNLCELGPRSTGKSHLYKEISPNSILVSGGQTTVANLFYNMGRKIVGLVGLWDCVAFDEVAGIRFKDKDGVQIMKDYMASGSFARGKEEKAASASMVSSMMLSAVDSKLRMEMGSEKMLAGILEPLRGLYDYIIVDICPSLGTLTINTLTAADEVIIAVNPQLLAMMGLQDFIRTVKKVRSRLNDRLQIAGILLTMCDARTNLCKVITEQLTDTFDGQIRIFKSIIPNTVKVGESIYYSEPLLEYAPENKACKAYRNLAEEVTGDES